MEKISTKLTPLLRAGAAGMLLLWLAAVTTCSKECLGDDCHAVSAPKGQIVNMANGLSHNTPKQDCHDDSLCDSLHSLCPATPNLTLIKPDFGLAFALDFISTAQIVDVASSETFVSRQPPDREFVFTPEVCLGAAFRSLAPPVLL
jgi:hypothetical protein